MKRNALALAKAVVSPALRLAAKIRLAAKLRTAPPSRLILGASTTRFEGWLPTDISPRAKYYLDAARPWPIARGSLEAIYADNMIEHVRLAGARVMLAEAFAALRPGGRIRLACPDIEATARLYLNPSELSAKALARARDDDGAAGVYPVDIIRCVLTQAGHAFGQAWDAQALGNELSRAGFVEVVKCRVGESEHALFRGLEQRNSDEAERVTTLVMEARKPATG